VKRVATIAVFIPAALGLSWVLRRAADEKNSAGELTNRRRFVLKLAAHVEAAITAIASARTPPS
jgi:hypothetical protein